MNNQIIRNISISSRVSSYFRNPVTCYAPETIKCKKSQPRDGALIGWSTFMKGKTPTFSYGRWYEETNNDEKTKQMRLKAVTEFYNYNK